MLSSMERSSGLRMKRALVVAQALLESESDDDEGKEPCDPPRISLEGWKLRRGGWHPQPRQDPTNVGMAKWRHDYTQGFISRLLERQDGSDYWASVLRARIGTPPALLAELVQEASSYPEIRQKEVGDGNGKSGPSTIPLNIKISAVLSWMRTGGSLQGAADRADIDVQTLRRFRDTWAAAVKEREYSKWVKKPSGERLQQVLAMHAKLGFPGCVSFTDGVQRLVDRVPYSQTNAHLGKDKTTTRGHMVWGDASGYIHESSMSFPGATNDKTMAQYDRFAQGLKDGSACGEDGVSYGSVEFDLLTSNEGDKVTERGLYAFTDNGLHPWRCFQYPSKEAASLDEQRWSVRGESCRKPGSECIFGRLKKRWLVFKEHWVFSGNANFENACMAFDNLWYVALMLQNRLMHFDGTDNIGTLGTDYVGINMAVDRERLLHRPVQPQRVPVRVAAFTTDGEDPEQEYQPEHTVLHKKLVKHFAHAWDRHEIYWLKTAKSCRDLRNDTRPPRPGHRRHPIGGADLEDEGAGFDGFASDYSTDDE